MSKYTHEQLTAMAKSLQYRKTVDPMGYEQFLQVMHYHTFLNRHSLEIRIQMMADGDFSFEEE